MDADRREGSKELGKDSLHWVSECPRGESEVTPGNVYLLHLCLVVCLEVTF